MTENFYDVIIIGGGPAGVSASLYIKRANLNVLLIHNGKSALFKAHSIENFYAFYDSSGTAGSFTSGENLYNMGIKQAENLGVNVLKDEAVNIEYDFNNFIFTVGVSNNIKYNSRAVLIATGTEKKSPDIENLKNFEGRGVSYCAVCDAFFYRKKDVAVLGSGDYALHEANELTHIAESVIILSNCEEITADFKNYNYNIIPLKINRLSGENKLERVIFEDGTFIDIHGLFVAVGSAGSLEFAQKIGVETEGGNIKLYENNRTSIEGLYVAGDNMGKYKQVAEAVYNGMTAAFDIIKFVRNKNK